MLMRYLLDTCTFIDLVIEQDNLSKDILNIIYDDENLCYISQETVREVILKYKSKNVWRKKWKTAEEIVTSVYAMEDVPVSVLKLDKEHFKTYANLEINERQEHGDPSDHLIIAHAITNRIPLISKDHKFKFYKKQGLVLIPY